MGHSDQALSDDFIPVTRCFVAFELDEPSRAYLAGYVVPVHAALKTRQRWPMRLVRPENWHLTVLFFEELSAAEREEVWKFIEPTATRGGWGELAFDWRGLALWPNPRRPSLVALEAEPYALAQSWPIAPLLNRPPFSQGETRHFSPFRPHITVMRFDPRWRKTIAEDWAAVTQDLEPIDSSRLRFVELSLVLSTLTPEESVYVRERRVRLG